VNDVSQGPQLDKIRALCAYWADGYDWRACEALLNGFGQYTTIIDDLSIHFVHVRSSEPDALPLLMSHGWPGSVLEFLKLIGPLTNPRAHGGDPTMAFDVVAPSMPGFGFSEKPTNTGWNMDRIADAYVALMGRLGYERWGMQGGDLGCAVSDIIARKAPDGCIGMHLNFANVSADTRRNRRRRRRRAGDVGLGHGVLGHALGLCQGTVNSAPDDRLLPG
jgi:epoxide hydrolase